MTQQHSLIHFISVMCLCVEGIRQTHDKKVHFTHCWIISITNKWKWNETTCSEACQALFIDFFFFFLRLAVLRKHINSIASWNNPPLRIGLLRGDLSGNAEWIRMWRVNKVHRFYHSTLKIPETHTDAFRSPVAKNHRWKETVKQPIQ